jgi:hypothetical protein
VEPIEPPRRGRPPGSKNRVKPAPIPLPPRPVELTDDLVGQINELINRFNRSRLGRGVVHELLSTWLTWLVAASGETDVARVRATLLAWGIACEPRDVTATRLQAAITQAAGHTPAELYQEIRGVVDDPLRRRLVRLCELYSWISGVRCYNAPSRYRGRCLGAIAAIALILVVRDSSTLTFTIRQLSDEIERSVPGSLPILAISRGVGALPVVQIVWESRRTQRIVGEKSDIIKKLDKFSLKQLQLLESEYREFSDKIASPGVVSA